MGDRIRVANSECRPEERPIEVRRYLAARAFERWRRGLLELRPEDYRQNDK
jgi:hypothetical protein